MILMHEENRYKCVQAFHDERRSIHPTLSDDNFDHSHR